MPPALKTTAPQYKKHIFLQYGVLLLVFTLVVGSTIAAKKLEKEKFIANALSRCQVMEVATADIMHSGAENWVTLIQARIDALQKKDPNLIRLSVIAKTENGSYLHVASSSPSRIGKAAHLEDLEAFTTGNIVILEEPYQDATALDITYPVHSFEGSIVALLGYTAKGSSALGSAVILGTLSCVSLILLSLFHIFQTRTIIKQSKDFQQSQECQQSLSRKLAEEEQLRLIGERSLQQQKLESLGLLAGGIAHNFNNNLAIILGNIELAQINLSDRSQNFEPLDNAKTAVMRSRDLVQKLMTYSRSNDVSQKPIKLYPVIDETLSLLISTIPKTIDSKVSISTAGQDAIIVANPTQIQDALINLCTNAVQAMNENGEMTVSLDIETLAKKDIRKLSSEKNRPGNYLALSVKDTGIGIPENIAAKIFDPFFSTKDASVGAGMGLATIHATMDSHNGLIKVESLPEKGSTFTLYFPITEKQQTETVIESSYVPKGKQENILFLDDEQELVEVWSQMIRKHGYRVTTTSSSLEALDLFNQDPDRFDLIITDQTMPELSGKEFLKKVFAARPDLPTILYTGFSTKIDAAEAQKLGVSAFCQKPLNLTKLMQTISRVLANR